MKNVDFGLLKEFIEKMISSTPIEKIKVMNKLQLIKDIRNYETFLFDKYRNRSIELRGRGQRMKFTDLTETENMNYIKYHINNPIDLFKMHQHTKNSPALVSQYI